MAAPSSPNSNSDKEGETLSAKYIPKFLVLIFIVIFYMIEEQAWYADDFHNPKIDASQIDNYDILPDQSFKVNRKTSIDTFSRDSLKLEKKNGSINCREVTVKGWPPDKSRNMTLYLKPNENTTLILPRVLVEARSQNISYDDKLFNKTHILIVCQSAVEDSRERRDVIRKTWMKDTEKLPVVVIFLVGMVSDNNPNKTRIHQEILEESTEHGDILQESFIDSYYNLTLKSMFTLKLVNQLMNFSKNQQSDMLSFKRGQNEEVQNHTESSQNQNRGYNITYVFKVDDDCYVNPSAILTYTRVIRAFPNAIVGHVLGAGSPVIRPRKICDNYNASTSDPYIIKWETPTYIYPSEKFPNALSGSGYMMRSHVAKCVYEKGLDIPFVNLEDIFITGLAAEKCKDEGVALRNSPRFHYMGRHLCLVKKYDILVHRLKKSQEMINVYDRLHKKLKCKTLERNSTSSHVAIQRLKSNISSLITSP